MREFGIEVKERISSIGHVRLRKRMNQEPIINLFGEAQVVTAQMVP